MLILCAIGSRGGPELVRRVAALVGQKAELLLLHVTDTGPRHELERLGGPLGRRPPGGPAREREIDAAEEYAGQAAL